MSPLASPMTVEEFYRLPDDETLLELVAGSVVSEPLPGCLHGLVAATFGSLLYAHVRARSLGAVVLRGGFVLARSPDTLRVPDLAFVTTNRWPGVDPHLAFEGPPDLAVEILTPSDHPDSIHGKVADYLAAGTRLAWVVDPESETVSVYRSLFAPRTLEKGETLEGEDVVPGFRVAVEELFAE